MMKILAVDDEKLQLKTLVEAIEASAGTAELASFGDPIDAWEYAKEHPVDIAFLDIQMPGMNGVTLGQKLKLQYPKCNIIFCTAYDEYALSAMAMHASGYLTKPITAEAVRGELQNLRYSAEQSAVDKHGSRRVQIQCFGNFEMYVDHKPFPFPGDKSRELVAYLVDRKGATCLNAEIESVIFEDGKMHTSYMQKMKRELKAALQQVGCEELINISWGKMSINRDMVDCDYYEWLEGTARGLNAYQGEYLSNYSWAEFTNGLLSREE